MLGGAVPARLLREVLVDPIRISVSVRSFCFIMIPYFRPFSGQ